MAAGYNPARDYKNKKAPDVGKWFYNLVTKPANSSGQSIGNKTDPMAKYSANIKKRNQEAAQTASSGSSGSSSGSGSSGGSGGSKSYTTSSGSSSGGGGTSTKTTKKTETYYERTTTTQDTVETTTITYKITKNDKTTLDDGSTITDIRLFDSNPANKFLPQTNGIGLDDLFAKCEWDTKSAQEKGAALTTNYTKDQFKAAIIENNTPTNGTEKTGNNIGEDGSDIGRIILNNNDFSYIFGAKSDAYIYDPNTDSYIENNNTREPSITYTKNDDSCEVTLKYYEDIIRPQTNAEWMGDVKNNERPSFAQILVFQYQQQVSSVIICHKYGELLMLMVMLLHWI